MKSLENVRKFYIQVEIEAKFDYGLVGKKFEDHDVFANPPQFHNVDLPYLGEVELMLIAIQESNKSFSHCIVQDEGDSELGDGKYKFGSRVSFFAKPTPTLTAAGFKPEKYGKFSGLVDLTCNQGIHNNLFGHPMKHFDGGKWPKKTTVEFCTQNLPKIIKYHRSKFYPDELHEYPFRNGEYVTVFVKDVTKIGGCSRPATAEKAMDIFLELYDNLYDKENGNVVISGHVAANGIRWIIPAFGKNHVGRIK